MRNPNSFDVIIIGGSYSGLSTAMALGRSLKEVLIIDAGKPCNRFTRHAHNFITQDGTAPGEITSIAKEQVLKYPTISWMSDLVVSAKQENNLFQVKTQSGETFYARRLHIAIGIKDLLPDIPGIWDCWGKTVVHCPFCHGYEVKNLKTGLIGNDETAVHFALMLKNWAHDLTLLTNAPTSLNQEQVQTLEKAGVSIIESSIKELQHENGALKHVHFDSSETIPFEAIYHHPKFELHSDIPNQLGCQLNEQGYLQVSPMQETTVSGVFASGDCTNPMRSVSMAVSSGTMAGAAMAKSLIFE